MVSGFLGSAAKAALIIGGLAKAPLLSIIVAGVIVLAFFVFAYRLASSEKGRARVKYGSFEFRVDPFKKSKGGSA